MNLFKNNVDKRILMTSRSERNREMRSQYDSFSFYLSKEIISKSYFTIIIDYFFIYVNQYFVEPEISSEKYSQISLFFVFADCSIDLFRLR